MKKIGMGLAGVALAAAVVFGSATASFAATNLGGLSVQTACNGFKAGSTAVVASWNAGGWVCRKAGTSDLKVGQYMMSWSCLQKYGGPVSANYTAWNDPYSWRCYR